MTFDEPLPDGIYLNLTDAEYFGQEARGSSEIVRLHQQRWGWWWGSVYNPGYKRTVTPEMAFGTALHALLLEGEAAYDGRYAIEPDKAEYPNLCTTIEDMQKALTGAGYDLTGVSSKWKKPDWCAAMLANLPEVPVWDNLMTAFNANLGPPGPSQKLAISADDDRALRFMREVAVGEDMPGNDDVRKLLTSPHPLLAEVAIFATVDGIRRRWKIDRMFPAFDTDLKSIGNWSGRPLAYELGDHMARKGWDIQRADYFDGRRMAYGMLATRGEAAIHGGSPEQRRFLASFPEKFPTWDWVWLAYQKPSTTGRAPVIIPIWDDSVETMANGEVAASRLRAWGGAKKAKALMFYREAVEKFGFDRPWADVECMHYTDENLEPHVVLPHWIAEEAPTTEAAYVGS